MDRESVLAFMQAVERANWHLDYASFVRRLGRERPDVWTSEKWDAFHKLYTALCSFNVTTLMSLLD